VPELPPKRVRGDVVADAVEALLVTDDMVVKAALPEPVGTGKPDDPCLDDSYDIGETTPPADDE